MDLTSKYEGMLSHSFHRFYVVTKFILPTIKDFKLSPIEFGSSCNYLNVALSRDTFPTQYIPSIKKFCKKIIPFIDLYKKQVDFYNQTAHEILTKEISLILSSFPKDRKERRSIISSLVSGLLDWPKWRYIKLSA